MTQVARCFGGPADGMFAPLDLVPWMVHMEWEQEEIGSEAKAASERVRRVSNYRITLYRSSQPAFEGVAWVLDGEPGDQAIKEIEDALNGIIAVCRLVQGCR